MRSIHDPVQPGRLPTLDLLHASDTDTSLESFHQNATIEPTDPSVNSSSGKGTSLVEVSGLDVTGASALEKVTFSETSNKILEIIFDYALNKFKDTKQRLEAGRPKFLAIIDRFVAAGIRVEMCLPAFPFKSANKVYKVLGSLPDKAEDIALERLDTMCIRIGEIYAPGARCTIISDGVVYNGQLHATWNGYLVQVPS